MFVVRGVRLKGWGCFGSDGCAQGRVVQDVGGEPVREAVFVGVCTGFFMGL